MSALPDEDYEYRLAGVLVHAGVAQGGHYYSFIKDRFGTPQQNGGGGGIDASTGSAGGAAAAAGADKWYRFDDEDVTPFDPSSIEVECFGGKVKKETKWPNGQVHTVESEQFANALMLFYEKVKPAKFDESNEDEGKDAEKADTGKDGEKEKEKEGGDAPMDEAESLALENVPLSSGFDVFQQDVRRSNKIHSWHNFLFDAEFLQFLKGLLDLCIAAPTAGGQGSDAMELSTPIPSPTPGAGPPSPDQRDSDSPWRVALLDLSFQYFFGILLHSVEGETLSSWTSGLKAALEQNRSGATLFARELARRTKLVSTNWIRVFCSDCPEEASREAAIKVVATALRVGFASSPEEQDALERWSKAWRLQAEEREKRVAGARGDKQKVCALPMPTNLQGPFKAREDVVQLGESVSSLGVILSFLNSLLEVAPRSWRYNSDLCLLLRELASLDASQGGSRLRNAMIEAQIPARLVALAVRERSPFHVRAAFPGASVSLAVAEAMLKAETTPSSHLMPMSGGAAGGNVNAQGGNATMPSPSDYLHLLEALACIAGVRHARRTLVVAETGEFTKGRPLYDLTIEAREALTIIFRESVSVPAAGGMSHGDVVRYMRQCGVEANNITAQKVSQILAKYETTGGVVNEKEARFLTLDGFLEYYRDTTQSNDAQQTYSDLNAFGFRPDLTRRAEQDRRYASGDRQKLYQTPESIALDVVSLRKGDADKLRRIGKLAEMGLASFQFYSLAYGVSEIIAEYVLASFALGRDTTKLLVESLRTLNRAQNGWAGTELSSACLMVFRVLAAVPDSRQPDRIAALMQCTEKAQQSHHPDIGVGLLVASKELARHQQHFQQGSFERYVGAVRELQRQREVKKWMSENEQLWGWMEQWLRPQVAGQQHQMRGEYGVHPPSAPMNHHHHHHSDSDMNASEDDDSRYDQESSLDEHGGRIIVEGAGVHAVNGVYTRDGHLDNVGKYSKTEVWDNDEAIFSLFRCKLSDGTRRWYISIVPKGIQPGTNKDIDFYSAPIMDEFSETPPEERWTTAKGEGIDPAPVVFLKHENVVNTEDQVDGDGRFVEGDNEMDDEGTDGQNLGYL